MNTYSFDNSDQVFEDGLSSFVRDHCSSDVA